MHLNYQELMPGRIGRISAFKLLGIDGIDAQPNWSNLCIGIDAQSNSVKK